MAFREDIVPECRSTAHPAHTDRRRWMKMVREEADFVVWCCQRCTEIAGVPAIQVRMLPRGQARARYTLGPQEAEKHRMPAPRRRLPADVHIKKPEEEVEL